MNECTSNFLRYSQFPAYQNILKSAVVVDCLVREAAGLSQVMVAVRMGQPERLCNHTNKHTNTNSAQ